MNDSNVPILEIPPMIARMSVTVVAVGGQTRGLEEVSGDGPAEGVGVPKTGVPLAGTVAVGATTDLPR
jgi:hypothetical protein